MTVNQTQVATNKDMATKQNLDSGHHQTQRSVSGTFQTSHRGIINSTTGSSITPRLVFKKKPRQIKGEAWAFSAGYKAFRLRIFPDGCPYKLNRLRAAWFRGYKVSEKDLALEIKKSKDIQATLPIEEE